MPVSDTITVLPSGDTASTFPVTSVLALTLIGAALGLSVIKPCSLPRNAFLPSGLKTKELGGLGRGAPIPRTLVDVLIGKTSVVQPRLVPQPVLVTNAVVVCAVEFDAGVTVKASA